MSLRFASIGIVLLLGCGTSGSGSTGGDAATDGRALDGGRDGTTDSAGGGDASRDAHADAAGDAARDAPSDGKGDAGGSCPDTGSGKSTYTCPSGGTDVLATDDLGTAVTAAAENATLCIHGPHRITAPLKPKKGQTWIGVDTTAAIDGSAVLDSWAPASGMTGVWVYTGALAGAAGQPNQNGVMSGTGSSTVYACFLVSTYEDDVFYNDQRVMRVLSTSQLSGTTLPAGQAITAAETGRFFFDYAGKQIYLALDPTAATVDLATVTTLIDGQGVSGVTLQNLLVQKALGNAIVSGQSWIMTDLTVRYAHETGLDVGGGTMAAPTTLERVLSTSNGRYGLAGAGTWLVVEDSELSWNNIANHVRVSTGSSGACDYMTGTPGGYWGSGAAKIVLSAGGSTTNPDFKLIDMQSHDNVGAGFWTDVNNRYVLVQGGRFHGNEWVGYFHEIGCDIEITGIESDHNGTPIKNTGMPGYGIQISDSNNANVHDNVLHDNASGPIGLIWQQNHSGINGMAGCISPAPTSDTDTSHVLENDTFANNEAYSCDTHTRIGMEYGSGEIITSRMNAFTGNAYHVPSTTGTWWSDPDAITWAKWQGYGLDTAGTNATPCTYTKAASCGK
jgi:hypothetical protein